MKGKVMTPGGIGMKREAMIEKFKIRVALNDKSVS
jgi:hypothetical protein